MFKPASPWDTRTPILLSSFAWLLPGAARRASEATPPRVLARWQRWLAKYQVALRETGLPREIIRDATNWLHFMEFGEVQGMVSVHDLRRDGRLQLCCILESMATDMSCRPRLLRLLQRQLGR